MSVSHMHLVLNCPPQRGIGPAPDATPIAIMPLARHPVLRRFADRAALARFIHAERAGRGLHLAAQVLAYDNSGTFAGFTVSFEDAGGAAHYAFSVAGVGRHLEALQAALAETNPDMPDARPARARRRLSR